MQMSPGNIAAMVPVFLPQSPFSYTPASQIFVSLMKVIYSLRCLTSYRYNQPYDWLRVLRLVASDLAFSAPVVVAETALSLTTLALALAPAAAF